MGKPSVPDPQNVAHAQTASNIGTAIANTYLSNANTFTPFGSTIYNKTGDTVLKSQGFNYDIPRFSVTQNLSPDQQKLLDLQEQAGQNLGSTAVNESGFLKNYLSQPLDTSQLPKQVTNAPNAPNLQGVSGNNLPDLQTRYGSGGNIQQNIGPADYSQNVADVRNSLLSRLDPQVQRDEAALRQRLANQGITQGSQAYNNAIDAQGRQTNDLRLQAELAATQEQSRLAGLDLAKGQFANSAQAQGNAQNAQAANFYNSAQDQQLQNLLGLSGYNNQVRSQNFDMANQEAQNQQILRQQALQEDITQRNQPLSEVSQLLYGSQPTVPQFQQFAPGHVADTPVGQYIYQSAAMNNQAQNATNGGLFGLGSSFLGSLPFLFSDERLKENIEPVSKTKDGQKIYSYNYKHDPAKRTHLGLMAQEVEKKHPEAVVKIGGYRAVDYAKALENA